MAGIHLLDRDRLFSAHASMSPASASSVVGDHGRRAGWLGQRQVLREQVYIRLRSNRRGSTRRRRGRSDDRLRRDGHCQPVGTDGIDEAPMRLDGLSIRQNDAASRARVPLFALGISLALSLDGRNVFFGKRRENRCKGRHGNVLLAQDGTGAEGGQECGSHFVVLDESRSGRVADEEEGTFVHHDLLVDIMRQRSAIPSACVPTESERSKED
jgi:hypothetical protein